MAVRGVIGTTLVGVLFWPTNADACTCRDVSFEENLKGVDIAFRGRVTGSGKGPMSDAICHPSTPPAEKESGEELGDLCEIDPEACPPYRLEFAAMEVLETIKGPRLQQAKVISCLPGCGGPFDALRPPALGTEYVILGWQRDGYVDSAPCMSMLVRKDEERVDRATGRGCAGCVVGPRPLDASALLPAALLVLARLRRRRLAPNPHPAEVRHRNVRAIAKVRKERQQPPVVADDRSDYRFVKCAPSSPNDCCHRSGWTPVASRRPARVTESQPRQRSQCTGG